jgi:NAD(P)-dependent dehydrogenase (short-subunit alcohol dehydrogenase family)
MGKGSFLVTGASTGIGHACAIRFAQLGYRILAGLRKSFDGEGLTASSSGRIEPVLLDVTRCETIDGALLAVGDDALIGIANNAGIATAGPLKLLPLDSWRRQFEVNALGLVAMTQACLPLLRPSRGRIVNIGSIAGRNALPGSAAYDSSKFAVQAITDALRMELHPWGISVSLIEAGAVATPIWEKSRREADDLRCQVDLERYGLYRGLMETVREEPAEPGCGSASAGDRASVCCGVAGITTWLAELTGHHDARLCCCDRH